jgi:hypothetical protein
MPLVSNLPAAADIRFGGAVRFINPFRAINPDACGMKGFPTRWERRCCCTFGMWNAAHLKAVLDSSFIRLATGLGHTAGSYLAVDGYLPLLIGRHAGKQAENLTLWPWELVVDAS